MSTRWLAESAKQLCVHPDLQRVHSFACYVDDISLALGVCKQLDVGQSCRQGSHTKHDPGVGVRSSYWNAYELRSFPTKRVVDDDMEVRSTGGPFNRWLADGYIEEVAVEHLPAAQR